MEMEVFCPINSRTARAGKEGFTLLELLVVIAVTAALAGLLFPALAGARSKAQSIHCVNNHRQLALVTMLYVSDHNDALPFNFGAADTRKTVSNGTFQNWANNVLSWELDADNTNTLWLESGGIGPYLNGNMSPFLCPADFVLDDLQRRAGWTRRVRSVSMNAMVGNAGEFSAAGFNTNNPHYRQFFRLSQIPNPSQIFLYIDEHPDSIDDGYFLNRAYSGEWHDLPASYHDGAATLSFTDGHVESHEWQHPSTRPAARPDAAGLPFAYPVDARDDFKWLIHHTSVKTY